MNLLVLAAIIPVKTGIQSRSLSLTNVKLIALFWIPTFVGMTREEEASLPPSSAPGWAIYFRTVILSRCEGSPGIPSPTIIFSLNQRTRSRLSPNAPWAQLALRC